MANSSFNDDLYDSAFHLKQWPWRMVDGRMLPPPSELLLGDGLLGHLGPFHKFLTQAVGAHQILNV